MASVSQFTTVKHNVTLADAVRFIDGIDAHLESVNAVDIVRKYASVVLSEIRAMSDNRENDPRTHAQCAVLFGILSPQCKFDKNVRASWRLMCRLYDQIDTSVASYDETGPFGKGAYCVEIVRIMTDNGADNFLTAKPASVKLARSLEYIRTLDADSMNLAAMRQAVKDGAVVGLADKTMRMSLALFDGGIECYTLDVHMLRGIQRSYGGTVAGEMAINTSAYDAIEAAMVAWHARNFPTIPTFVSQWALWNEWGFGKHQSHLAIFGL